MNIQIAREEFVEFAAAGGRARADDGKEDGGFPKTYTRACWSLCSCEDTK